MQVKKQRCRNQAAQAGKAHKAPRSLSASHSTDLAEQRELAIDEALYERGLQLSEARSDIKRQKREIAELQRQVAALQRVQNTLVFTDGVGANNTRPKPTYRLASGSQTALQ